MKNINHKRLSNQAQGDFINETPKITFHYKTNFKKKVYYKSIPRQEVSVRQKNLPNLNHLSLHIRAVSRAAELMVIESDDICKNKISNG